MNPLIVSLCASIAAGFATVSQEAPRTASDLTGSWTWSWKDADGNTHRHLLVIEGEPGNQVGREKLDELEPTEVQELGLKNDVVSFAVVRGETRAEYTGKFADGDTINGEVRILRPSNRVDVFGWTAQRVKSTPEAADPPPVPATP